MLLYSATNASHSGVGIPVAVVQSNANGSTRTCTVRVTEPSGYVAVAVIALLPGMFQARSNQSMGATTPVCWTAACPSVSHLNAMGSVAAIEYSVAVNRSAVPITPESGPSMNSAFSSQ